MASREGGNTRTGQLIGRGVGGRKLRRRGRRAEGSGTNLLMLSIPYALPNAPSHALCSASQNIRNT